MIKQITYIYSLYFISTIPDYISNQNTISHSHQFPLNIYYLVSKRYIKI